MQPTDAPAKRSPDRPRSNSREVLDAWTRALQLTATIDQNPHRLLPDLIAAMAAIQGDAPALISDEGELSYRSLTERINRYSRWALTQGVRAGDVVALLMPNQADYLAIWLGITQVGGVVALLNDQLREGGLDHCVVTVAPRHLIAAAAYAAAARDCQRRTGLAFGIWAHGEAGPALDRIDTAAAHLAADPLTPAERRPVSVSDLALYIFTSGTTGLPKAANISHRRLLTWSLWFAGLIDVKPSDRMYNCLPMHHSVGGVVAIGSLLTRGGSVVLRRKFSTQAFWNDVVGFQCTLFQYIGELCRYLLKAPPHPAETRHRLRACCGNGLRAEVWDEFKSRFRIPQIVEFYAASEGSFSLVNLEGRPGSIGRVPPFLSHRFPAEIVQYDPDRELPVHDAGGFCIRCGHDEVGEAIGRLDAGSGVGSRFEGYSSREDTERKILRDVFAPGDAWFRTGDLMRRDAANFFYFVDRIGDTFRWKGENVSTLEVADVLADCPGVLDATVYGVGVSGADGRAGMAAIVPAADFDITRLETVVTSRLPVFARPLFLRLCPSLDLTATFKLRKQDLQAAGYDPARCHDPLFMYDKATARYRPFDAGLHSQLLNGGIAV
ncbi:MAG: long-chain-acyl-CoA synthetase [Xanthobacteraceae bacterium]|nr:long-chain-acyl-CoA synthetase [Xanthobacteraceae bacterium]